MGYLTDNTPHASNSASCHELYLYRIIISPGFASDLELQQLVRDVVPDPEEWQFSGRQHNPPPGGFGKSPRVVHPATYAQNSRKMRVWIEQVYFAFHTEEQRASVAARLSNRGFSYRLQNEPSDPNPIIVVVP
jgi:hypothetical protein